MATDTAPHSESDMETDTVPETPPAPAPGGRSKLKTMRDMVLTTVVIAGSALALYILDPHEPAEDQFRPVEYEVASATAARAAPYEVLVPRGLPDEWRATSVRYDPLNAFGPTWHLGFVDPGDEYAALAQSDGHEPGFVSSITQQAHDTGAVARVAGQDWARYEGPTYDALVRHEPGATTIVFGTARLDTLTYFAGTLRPADR